MITGLADKTDDIDSVRAIVNSIQLPDHKKPAAPAPKQEEKKEDPVVERTGEMITLYNEMGNSVIVYGYTDGTYRSDDGNIFQMIAGNEFVDYSGNHYFQNYIPDEYQDSYQEDVENGEEPVYEDAEEY